MLAPERIWWKPLGRLEKTWLTIALVWCIFLTLMMPIWYFQGRQNVPAETYKTTPAEYAAKVNAFVDQYKIGDYKFPLGNSEATLPLVAPPPGSDVYVRAQKWSWYPVLQLVKGETYRLHLSSLDLQHGFSLQPVNINLQVLPGYEYVATVTPTNAGEFILVCNEYCEVGHHTMAGRIVVVEE